MCGGGTQTTTQEVKIPPEVMARYNAVNARAEEVAQQPFQKYSGEFVAPLTGTQQAGIGATSQYSQYAQPAFQMGQGLTLSGARDVGPLTGGQIGYYMNPFLQNVADPTIRALQQQQGRDRAMQQAQAIKSGAFGGDRAGIERAVLQGQQELATGQAIAPIFAQGYQSAVNTAQGQQGVVAADLARRMQAGQQYANLGQAGQQAALQGAQAQIQAGTLEQQTQQALDTAKYQQFLQERGYPFQVAQFLANIAMGTGALSGSTTTTQQPTGFFSDERLKENIERVGKTDDGQPIYRYNYKGDDRTQIGLLAQDVEKDHPEAVGEAYGYKTVDYEKATDDAARSGRAYGGGLDVNAFGGAVMEPGNYAGGGLVSDTDLSSILASQAKFFGPYAQGMAGQGNPYQAQSSIVPTNALPIPKLVTAGSMPSPQRSGLSQAAEMGSTISSLYKGGKQALVGSGKTSEDPEGTSGLIGGQGKMSGKNIFSEASDWFKDKTKAYGGGVIPREAYSTRGFVNPYGGVAQGYDPIGEVVSEGLQQHASLPKPGEPPKPQEPLKDVMQTGSQLYSAGKMGSAAIDKAKDLAGKITGDGLTPIAEADKITAMPIARPDSLGSIASAAEAPTAAAAAAPVAETAAAAAPVAETLGAGAAAAAPVAEGAGLLGSIGSGIGAGLGSVASGIGAAGTAAAEGLGTILSFLPFIASDERMKDNIRPVGKTFDGQNIYTYDFGDGRTQMGLIAQEVLGHRPDAVAQTKDGLLAVDYRRATDDAAPYAEGGVIPRQGYQEGGAPDPQQIFSQKEEEYGLPSGYLDRTWELESSRGKNMRTDKSSARGHFQFINGTAKAMGLNNPDDIVESADAAARYAAQNRDVLRKAGIAEPSAAHLYLAHNQGGLGAARLLNAGDTLAGGVVDPKAVSNNAGDPTMRGTDFANQIMSRYSGQKQNLGDQVRAAQDEKAAPAAAKDSGTNWEKILIPMLSGVGSALASQRTTLGGALGEGLMGGIAGYKDISKMQAEIPKTQAETQVQLSSADRINMATRALRAGMLDYKFIPDVGLQIFDKEGGIPLTVTDKLGRPLPGAEKLVQEFIARNPTFNFSEAAKKSSEAAKAAGPVQGGSGGAGAAGGTGAMAAPEGATSDITKFVPPDVHPAKWNATTKVPEGYQPDRQAAIMNPFNENRDKYVEKGAQQVKELEQKVLAAPDTQIIIDKMAKDFGTVNRNAFTASGPSAEARNRVVGAFNDAARVLGADAPIDPSNVAAYEGLVKGTTNLGFKTANGVTNSRIPFELVKSATSANPQIANSPLGAIMLLRQIEQSVQLERDKADFYSDYFRRFQNTENARDAFEKLNNPSKYVDRAIYNGMRDFIPQNQQEYLTNYMSNPEVAKNPKLQEKAMSDFDRQVGIKGAAKILLGAK